MFISKYSRCSLYSSLIYYSRSFTAELTEDALDFLFDLRDPFFLLELCYCPKLFCELVSIDTEPL